MTKSHQDAHALSTGLVIPTLNAGSLFEEVLAAVQTQRSVTVHPLVIDSGSSDDTVALARSQGWRVLEIPRKDFDHGATRQLGVEALADEEYVVFLTQDSILADDTALHSLLGAFRNTQVGMTYGRQLPASDADPVARHARLFNYPAHSQIYTRDGIAEHGFRSSFASNSFAAYRVEALRQIGGFCSPTPCSEDVYVAGRLLQNHMEIAYVADACAVHSHNYGLRQLFRRYFDIGAFHASQPWLMQMIGTPNHEGKRFLRSELDYMIRNAPSLLPFQFLAVLSRWFGYRFGLVEKYLPRLLKKLISMNPGYWTRTADHFDHSLSS